MLLELDLGIRVKQNGLVAIGDRILQFISRFSYAALSNPDDRAQKNQKNG
jgi:hypothetical protein